MEILVDFLKPWDFPDTIQEHSLPAAESVFLTSPDRVLLRRNVQSTCEILVDFLKVLRFHPYQFILAVLQPEFSSSNRTIFIPHTISASHWTQNDICFRFPHQSTRLWRATFIVTATARITSEKAARIISEKELFWTHKWIYYPVDQEMKITKPSRHELVSHVSRWFREMNRTKLQSSNKRCVEITTQLFT